MPELHRACISVGISVVRPLVENTLEDAGCMCSSLISVCA